MDNSTVFTGAVPTHQPASERNHSGGQGGPEGLLQALFQQGPVALITVQGACIRDGNEELHVVLILASNANPSATRTSLLQLPQRAVILPNAT